MARVGLLGGTFNPPHLGHLVCAQEAYVQLGLDRVLLVPTGVPAHRGAPAAPAAVRLRLAVAAARTDPRVFTSRVEVDRAGPSYMVDTLRELARQYPGRPLVLLLGADQLARLGTWHEAEQIPRLAQVAVAPRPGVVVEGLDRARVERVDMPLIDVSSTMIRARVAAGRSIRHLVPDPVRELIERESLYRGETTPRPGPRPTGVLAWDEDFPPVEEQR